MVRDIPMVPNRRTKGKKQKRGFPTKDFRNDGGGVIPEWFYHPYSSPRQSLSRGPEVSKNQRKSKNLDSRLKISGMTAVDGFLIKDFRHDGGGGRQP